MATAICVGIPNTILFQHWGTKKKIVTARGYELRLKTETRLQQELKTFECTARGRKSSHESHPAGPT
jgi:hypothetical protein